MSYLYFIISITSSASSLVDFSLNSSLDRALKQKKLKEILKILQLMIKKATIAVQQAQVLGAELELKPPGFRGRFLYF